MKSIFQHGWLWWRTASWSEKIGKSMGRSLATTMMIDERGNFIFRQRNTRSYGLEWASYHLWVRNPPDTWPIGHGNRFEQTLKLTHLGSHVHWDLISGLREILHHILHLLNSNDNFKIDNSLQLDVAHIIMPIPGRVKNDTGVLAANSRKRNAASFAIEIKTTSVAPPVSGGRQSKSRWGSRVCNLVRWLSYSRTTCQRTSRAGPRTPRTLGIVRNSVIWIILSEYQVIVILVEHGHNIIHQGPDSDIELVLLMHDGHFDVITKLSGFLHKNYFCKKCKKGLKTNDLAHHRCPGQKCFCSHQKDCADLSHFRKNRLPYCVVNAVKVSSWSSVNLITQQKLAAVKMQIPKQKMVCVLR